MDSGDQFALCSISRYDSVMVLFFPQGLIGIFCGMQGESAFYRIFIWTMALKTSIGDYGFYMESKIDGFRNFRRNDFRFPKLIFGLLWTASL